MRNDLTGGIARTTIAVSSGRVGLHLREFPQAIGGRGIARRMTTRPRLPRPCEIAGRVFTRGLPVTWPHPADHAVSSRRRPGLPAAQQSARPPDLARD